MENLKRLIKCNEFKSDDAINLSPFGKLSLCDFSNDLFKSKILTEANQAMDLIGICEFSPNDTWTLLYRGSRDGFGTDDFHSKCDDHENTLTIIQTKVDEFTRESIFGGFTKVAWDTTSKFKMDGDAFVFSLKNNDNHPCKMKIIPSMKDRAIYCNAYHGVSFGSSEIYIRNKANENTNSFSFWGRTFELPIFLETRRHGVKEFLGSGSLNFKLNEIEVYKKSY
jgi:hypothetical protein